MVIQYILYNNIMLFQQILQETETYPSKWCYLSAIISFVYEL